MSVNTDAETELATAIGKVVLRLAQHEPGRWGDCSLNDGIVSIIDAFKPAHELINALVDDPEHIKGLAARIDRERNF